jgi:hypothetical protein
LLGGVSALQLIGEESDDLARDGHYSRFGSLCAGLGFFALAIWRVTLFVLAATPF